MEKVMSEKEESVSWLRQAGAYAIGVLICAVVLSSRALFELEIEPVRTTSVGSQIQIPSKFCRILLLQNVGIVNDPMQHKQNIMSVDFGTNLWRQISGLDFSLRTGVKVNPIQSGFLGFRKYVLSLSNHPLELYISRLSSH